MWVKFYGARLFKIQRAKLNTDKRRSTTAHNERTRGRKENRENGSENESINWGKSRRANNGQRAATNVHREAVEKTSQSLDFACSLAPSLAVGKQQQRRRKRKVNMPRFSRSAREEIEEISIGQGAFILSEQQLLFWRNNWRISRICESYIDYLWTYNVTNKSWNLNKNGK